MSKKLMKSILLRSKLKNTFNKSRSYENRCKYMCQCSLSLNLLRKSKRKFFRNLSEKKLLITRHFLKEIKPYFCGKGNISKKIMSLRRIKMCAKSKMLLNL